MEHQAAQLGVTISCDRSGISHPVVMASSLHLKRLIMNIASNAVKYNKPGGAVRVTCSEHAQEGGAATYRFVIADTGIGMSSDFQNRVFDPFSREQRKDAEHVTVRDWEPSSPSSLPSSWMGTSYMRAAWARARFAPSPCP